MDTNEQKKSQNRVKKEELVAELVEKLDSSNGLIFTDYQGLTHKQLEDLKKELKKLDSTIVVAKNSLLKLSLGKSKNFADYKDNEGLNQPTATLFLRGDMVEPLKKLQKVIKDLGLPKIKFGILEGNLTDEAGVLKIASLPNRETLLVQLVGTLNSPIQGLVVTLNANISKFVMTLNAIAQNKPAEPVAPATPVAEPTTTAEVTQATEETAPMAEQTPAAAEETPAVEAAAPANEPATQPEAPVETDESQDARSEVPSEEAKSEETTNEPTEEAKSEDQTNEEVKN